MAISKNASVGQIIRRIRAREFASVYTLYGGDSFLEDFIIQELYHKFLESSGEKVHLSLDQDSEELLFGELSSISLFQEKRIIIVREVKRLKGKNGREELIQYLKIPNPDIILLIINPEYDLKNAFLNKLGNASQLLDLRPPFKKEMKQWVGFMITNRNIQITDSALEHFIQNYGDSISHVINEIEKCTLLLGEGIEINDNFFEQSENANLILKQAGFSLIEKRHNDTFSDGEAKYTYNQIWKKVA